MQSTMSTSELKSLVLWQAATVGGVCLGVTRPCLVATLGPMPRIRDFKSQDEFHTAHQKWVDSAKQLATEILVNLTTKYEKIFGKKYSITVDAWDKPVLTWLP
jgi:hypothetical protein